MIDLNRMAFARFEANSSLKVLDFGYTPNNLGGMVGLAKWRKPKSTKLYDIIFTYLFYWPLICSCSIRVMNTADIFKPEYIMPQLMLQYVHTSTRGSIDGIRYFSMHFGPTDHNVYLGSNFVFPPKKISASGLCPILKSNFRITPVLDWKISQIITLNENYSKIRNGKIKFPNGIAVDYIGTDFAKIEARLSEMKAHNI